MTNDQTPTETRLFALLIGIDEYLAARDLNGCVNDVEAMRIMLENRYGVPAQRIRVLTNAEATRANILDAFQEHLIDNQDIRRGDQILFHYSGHGSQMQAAPEDYEPEGKNETLVPHDSRTAGVFDIPDKTLAGLLERLAAAKGDQITVILDSCHSGSATRGPGDPSAPRVRRAPADTRTPPADLDAGLRSNRRSATRSVGASGWMPGEMEYVLLAGCRDQEESNEHYGTIADTSAAWHGALTFFTLKTLRELPEGVTYRELHERVAPQVNATYRDQMPQCEGRRDRQIFSGVHVERDPFITVLRVAPDGTTVTLGAGLVHGLRPGTKLALYPPEVRKRAELPAKPLATVQVRSVAATRAEADVDGRPTSPIPPLARAVITDQADDGLRTPVRLMGSADPKDQDALNEVRLAIGDADGQPSAYVRIEDDPAVPVDLVVNAEGGRLMIATDTGSLLVEPGSIADAAGADGAARAIRLALESIVRFRTVLNLSNDTDSALAGKVRLRLRRYLDDASGKRAEDLPPESVSEGGELSLYFDPDDRNRNLFVVDVFNESDVPVYPHVFTLSPDFSITQLYPSTGQEEAVGPSTDGTPYPIGLQRGTRRLEVYLPAGWDASRDFLKAIVTTAPTDLETIAQDGLHVPTPPRTTRGRGSSSQLQQLIDTVAFGARGARFVRPDKQQAVGEDWAAATLSFNTIRKYESVPLRSPAGRVRISDEVTLIKPDGFTGEITVTTVGSATRGDLADPGLRLPPGLADLRDDFQLVGQPGTRGIGSTGFVFGLDVDDTARQLVSPDNPLRVEFSNLADDVTDLWPVIFDGEDYILGGYASESGNAVDLVSLPRPVAPTDAAGRPTTRGLGRTLRLFIFKKLGRHIPDLGLRRAELTNGEVVYRPVTSDEFRPGQRAAVFVHGLISDSRWMIQTPAEFLRRTVRYDHLLTWDYETFGTGVEANGAQLALALQQQCGFGPGDEIGLDVYAHSMGTLVSRCMIELSGGAGFVDRAVLAGPPNRGSTLATTGRLLPFLVTSLVNRVSGIPILGAVSWTLKQIFEQGVGLADLAVDSPIVTRLNALDKPSNVPYLVLAGENRLDPAEATRLKRLAEKVLDAGLDTIFGEQNDIAIGLSSMQALRGGAYPLLTTKVLPCDHFHYYAIPDGQEAISRWLTETTTAGTTQD